MKHAIIEPDFQLDYYQTPAESAIESKLSEEIVTLWSVHVQAQTSLKKTKAEVKTTRLTLSERLHEIKSLLSRPGRGGQWHGYLREIKIPRATADRLVNHHEKTLTPATNRLTESIPEPTEEDVRKLVNSIWPKLQRMLTTREALDIFVAELTARVGEQYGELVEGNSTP